MIRLDEFLVKEKIVRLIIRLCISAATLAQFGVTCHLQNEVGKAQRRSLRILGLNSDFLPSLETRRDKTSSSEFERICKDPEHQESFSTYKNSFITDSVNILYYYRIYIYLSISLYIIVFISFYVILESTYDCIHFFLL